MKKSFNPKPRLLFLYSELASYFISCLAKLAEKYDVEVHVVHWPVNKEAPFTFNFPSKICFHDKKMFASNNLRKRVADISPDFIYCSGWMDKDYLKTIRGLKKNIPVVMGLDTWWEGRLSQYLACLLSPFSIKPLFSHCWVPGLRQKLYAHNLRFKDEQIMPGYYSADTDYFIALGKKAEPEKRNKFPHRFIFTGRYYEFKGVTDLWDAFTLWKKETNNDWELWCLGTGSLAPAVHPFIRHFGFVQPAEIEPFIKSTGVFIMPSHFEPWGVALHEFTAAGFPVISSDRVGAAEAFLENGRNGYIYPSGNINKLKEYLNIITSLSDDTLLQMGKASRELSLKITPALWADTLMKTITPECSE